jgi:hypothetical protein
MAPAPLFPLKSPPLMVSVPVPAKLIAGTPLRKFRSLTVSPPPLTWMIANSGVPGAAVRRRRR